MRHLLLSTVVLPTLLIAAAASADAPGDAFFNGKDLTGFEGLIKEYWSVKNGAIVGYTEKDPGFNTFLCSKKKYKDFEMTFRVRLKDAVGNSGVQIRSKIINDKRFAVGGPQVDIGKGYWGSLYGEAFGGMMKAAPPEKIKAAVKEKEFNDYSIKAVGKHVTIKVNGETMVDQDFEKMPEDGIIAFQLHGGYPSMEVTFADIKVKELK
jgi:hypothetical protein